MTLYKKREKFGTFSIKVGIIFSKFGLSPNQWTILTLIPAIMSVYFLAKQDFISAALLFIIASFMDMIDGSVARVTGRASMLGAYLDTIVDRYVEALIIFGLLFVRFPVIPIPYLSFEVPVFAWIFLYFFGGMMTTYAKAAAKEKNIFKEKELKGGILERADRLILLFVGILLAYLDPLYLGIIIIALAILANISAIQRIFIAYKEANKRKEL